MSGAEMNFNAGDVPPSTSPPPVPAGQYRVHAVESGVKPTKDGKGRYLEIVFQVLDGEYKGRKIWDRLNIVNPNQKTQEIAQRTLSAICHAVGVLKLGNSSQLHHIPLLVRVKVTEDPGYGPKNEVTRYSLIEGGPGIKPPAHGSTAHGGQQAATVTSAAPTPTAPPAAAAPPWAQKKTA